MCSVGEGGEDVEQCCMRCLGYIAKLDAEIFVTSYDGGLPAGV